MWGSSVAQTTVSGSDAFFKALIVSSWMDALGEYDTVGVTAQGGATSTHQRIYRGIAVQTVTIQPKAVTGTLMPADIQTEIDAQVMAGVLPGPVMDPDGTADTIYSIAFPGSVTFGDGSGTTSCSGFGAFHDTIVVAGKTVPYSAVADCNNGSFGEFTVSASHELVEALTDATPSATTPVVGAQAWNDTQGYEAADICEGMGSGSVGSYAVADYWSNRLGSCIAGDPNLPLCDGNTRPCRPCSSQDCAAPQVCDTDAHGPTLGQCVALAADGGASDGASDDSAAGDGAPSSSGSSSGSGNSSGSSSGGIVGASSSGGTIGSPDAGAGDGGAGAAPGAAPSSGCACTAARANGSLGGGMGAAGLGVVVVLARRRRRRGRA
jgi:hypothetical protein